MTTKLKWTIGIAAAVVLLALLALGGYEWLQEHDAKLKADTVTTAQQQTIAQAQKSIDAAKLDQAEVATNLNVRIAALEAQKQQTVSPAKFVVDMSKLLPNLPQPVTVAQTAPTQKTVAGKEVPSASVVQIPEADLQTLQTYKLNCDENEARLGACQKTSTDLTTQLTGTHGQLNAMTVERDTWEKAAKGGTWWHRTLTAGKWIVIGGAVGYTAGRTW
jgi:DNA primase